MNRNHQSQNNQNHTARGRNNAARRQMGISMRTSLDYNPNEQQNTYYDYSQYVSANPDHRHNDNDLYDTSGPDRDYNYRSDGPGPIEIEARDKYTHNHDQNTFTDHHVRSLSARARKDMGEQNDDKFIRSYEGIGPKGYKRADRSIEEDVCEMLMQDRYVDAENITVGVENAVVKLGGTVKNRRDKFQIEEIAERASGVDDIVNDIRVVKN